MNSVNIYILVNYLPSFKYMHDHNRSESRTFKEQLNSV